MKHAAEYRVVIDKLSNSQIFLTFGVILVCSVLIGMFSKEEIATREEFTKFMNSSINEQRRTTVSFARKYYDSNTVKIYVQDWIGETKDFMFNNWFIFSVTATLTEIQTNMKKHIYQTKRIMKHFNMVKKNGILQSDPVELLEFHIHQESILNVTMKITSTGSLCARNLIFTIHSANPNYHQKIERARVLGSLFVVASTLCSFRAGLPNPIFTGVSLIGIVFALGWGSSRQRLLDVLFEKLLFAFTICGYSITSRKMRIKPVFLTFDIFLAVIWAVFDASLLTSPEMKLLRNSDRKEEKTMILQHDLSITGVVVLMSVGYSAILMSQGAGKRKINVVMFASLCFAVNIIRPFLTMIIFDHIIAVNKCQLISCSVMINYLIAAFGVYFFARV